MISPVRDAPDPLGSLAGARAFLESQDRNGGVGASGALARLSIERAKSIDDGAAPIDAFLSLLDSLDEEVPADRHASGSGAGEAGGALQGVPVAVKDNICTSEFPTTCGSRVLNDYRSPFVATAVRRLEAAGARIIGKTNCDEFAMGSSNENSAFGPTRNPIDRTRVPGGSSGGSAAAVAASIVPIALGSSTGGSVRQPAAFCGVVGVKPTYGRVSRYGLVAFASSLDQIGVLARSVGDAAVALEAISGFDELDATCQDRDPPRASALDQVGLENRVIGIPEEYFGEGLDPGIAELAERAMSAATDAGATIRRISLPTTSAAIPCYYVIAPAEASSNLARYDGVRYGNRVSRESLLDLYRATRGEGFGDEVKRRIMIGTYALSAGYYEAYYLKALRMRAALAAEFSSAFDEVDAIFAPTTPSPAFQLGEKAADPYEMYLADVYTVSANLAGLPAVSIPIGDVDGLPVGGQLMCAPWEEEKMLGIAASLEELIGYRHPLDDREAATG